MGKKNKVWGNNHETIQKVGSRNPENKIVEEIEKLPERVVVNEERERKREVQENIRKRTMDNTLTRFFEWMTKLERELDDQTQNNSTKLEAVMERTGNHFKNIQEDINKREKKIIEKIGKLTTQIMEKDERRYRAQLRRDREREKELDKRDQEQHGIIQKLLEKLAERERE